MTFDLQRILESKRAYRQAAASRPIAEKLRMLDALHDRTVALRAASVHAAAPSSFVREIPGSYGIPHGHTKDK